MDDKTVVCLYDAHGNHRLVVSREGEHYKISTRQGEVLSILDKDSPLVVFLLDLPKSDSDIKNQKFNL